MDRPVRVPVFSIPHGGGPWPFMKDAFGDPAPFDHLQAWLEGLGQEWHSRAKAILVVSAHWEAASPTVHWGARPGMLYDYGGFPDFAYQLQWPAPGAPDTARRVHELLLNAGFIPGREERRGYDHGTFIPLMLAFPQADLPVVQLSLVDTLDPDTHWRLGAALEPLRDEGVLILASGMSYHNMRGFGSSRPDVAAQAAAFDAWLGQTLALADPAARRQALAGWETAPSARSCHPRSEHLAPVFVAAGAAGKDTGRVAWHDRLMGVSVSGHVFGA